MKRVDPDDVLHLALGAVFRARRAFGGPLYRADAAITDAAVRLAIDEVFRGGRRFLIEPDEVPRSGNVTLAFGLTEPGVWGVTEPRPAFSNDPPAPPGKRAQP